MQALQYVQENPDEVCPAGWKPGDKSMKPDPKGSKKSTLQQYKLSQEQNVNLQFLS